MKSGKSQLLSQNLVYTKNFLPKTPGYGFIPSRIHDRITDKN